MTKIKYLRLVAALLLFMNQYPCWSQDKIEVVSSASIFQDMVKNIGGERVNATTIVPIGSDPHLYEPTPKDARLVQNADLILVNGLTFEGWINELVDNSGTSAEMIRITEGINAISSDTYKNAYDPHAWMDASNGLIYCKNILNALVRLAPEHKAYFDKNYKNYVEKVLSLDKFIAQAIMEIPAKQRILITSHDAFAYYGRRYGLTLHAMMGISTEADAQTSDIIRVSRVIKENKVPAIFIESTINPKLIQQIAKDSKVEIGGKLYADSLGPKGSDGDTYLKMLRHNTKVIVDALSKANEENDSIPEEKSFLAYLIFGVFLLLGLIWAVVKFK